MISCASKTKYRPSVYGHDFENMEIVTPISHERIYCGDPDFNNYVSVSLTDLAKLATILREAKLPKKVRRIIEKMEREVGAHKKSQALRIKAYKN